MSKNNINSLASLDRQIAVLNQQKFLMEAQFSKNWEYLKSDYPTMIKSTIFKDMNQEGRGSFFYWLFKVPEFQSTIGKSAEKLTIKLENLIVKLIDKIAG